MGRAGAFPPEAPFLAKLRAFWPDSEEVRAVVGSHCGSVTAGLLFGELPGVASGVGVCGDGRSAGGIPIIATDYDEVLSNPASDGEDSGRCVAVSDWCFRDGPAAARVGRTEDTSGWATGAKEDFLA